jgi:predicted metal-binding protein
MPIDYPAQTLSPDQMLNRIRGKFGFSAKSLQKQNIQTDRIVTQHPGLRAISDLTFLQEIDHPEKDLIKRAGFISPKVLFVSEKIKSLCHLRYRHSGGRIDPCGGIKKNYLACSPYSPHESEIRKLFSSADLFCFFQADGLTDMKQQKYLHEILFKIEEYLSQNKVLKVMSFGAGPCRICDRCAGEVKVECSKPIQKRFSLESCGIDVDWAMKMMVLKTKDNFWAINWLKDFGIQDQDITMFKSIIGTLLSTKKEVEANGWF